MPSKTRFTVGFGFAVTAWLAMPIIRAADRPQKPTFLISPARPLMDDRLAIQVCGLPPHKSVTIRAKSQSPDQRYWRSTAVFISGPDGCIDLTSQAPVSGSYAGIDAMGLFWSMQIDAGSHKGDHAFFSAGDCFAPIMTDIEAICDDHVFGSVCVPRHFAALGIHAQPVRAEGIIGALYTPHDGRTHPGVIVLGGSEGGFSESDAALLASRGFVALSVGYFGVKGLPGTLQRIPIEYFGKAMQWMRSLPDVDPEEIAVLGASRGAEAALIAASTYPEFKAVVAISPTHVLWEGATARQLPGGAAWTYNGNPLPFVPFHISPAFAARYAWSELTGNSVALTPMFLESLAHSNSASAEIPVERIHGPVLLLSGNDDHKWPSSSMSSHMVERLHRNLHPYRDEWLSYDGAGHWFPNAYVPTTGVRSSMQEQIGGTPEGTAKAQADSWPRVIGFLRRAVSLSAQINSR
jgi:dienelactone hydrolase